MSDYISRADVMNRLSSWREVIKENYGENDEYAICLEEAIDKIEDLPAADVRPVAHGHNTGNARIFECSECGYGFMDIFLTNERDYPIDPNYCPNCGADMRGES